MHGSNEITGESKEIDVHVYRGIEGCGHPSAMQIEPVVGKSARQLVGGF
jgi:hypothetical protein